MREHKNPKMTLPPLKAGDFYRYHTMAKPSGSQCNLDCRYCFYLHKENLLHQPKMPRMSNEVLEAHISQYIESQGGDCVTFTWQGGEPTLMGLEFFEQVVNLQAKYKKPQQRIENDIQTNGVLLDDKWCHFLKKNNFFVGISIDGPAELHDHYRISKGGKPTHERVMRAVDLLHRHEIIFNALCVVNDRNVREPLQVYRYLKQHVRPRVIQFIPGIEPKGFASSAPWYWNWDKLPKLGDATTNPDHPDSIVEAWSVGGEAWGIFLNTIWDEWLEQDYGEVFVDQFENVISMLLGYGSQKCVTSQYCGKGLALEYNGDLFSCDHFVYPEYKLGNILEHHEADLIFSERQVNFGFSKSAALPKYCQTCQYLQLCWGECPRGRFIKTPTGEKGLNYLCLGLKHFYGHVLASTERLQQRLQLPPQ